MGVDSRARLLAHRCVSSSIMMVYMLALTAAFLLPTTALGAVMSKKKISVAVYSVLPSPDAAEVARKQMHDLENSPDDTTQLDLTLNYLTLDQQRAFLLEHSEQCAVKGVTAVTVFDALNDSTSMQSELYKWCALATLTSQDMVLWLDSHSPILDAAALQRTLRTHDNVAVVLDEKNPHGSSSIHGSYFQMRNTAKNRQLAKQMLEILLQTETALLQTHALLVPHTLHGLIQKHNENWYLLQLKCRQGTATQQQESRSHLACPTGYCCSIQDVNAGRTLMISRHYVVPYQSIVSKHRFLSATQNGAIDDGDDERPFMSTVTVKEIHHPSDGKETPNFYEILEQAKCLPNDYCSRCLREKKGSTCESCAVSCPCYCTKLCHTPVPPKRIVQEWTVSPPLYAQDPSRLIPRIVHQTWFEAVQPEAYPNMSRLVESFRQSGWEYRFYNDNDAAAFLQRHFPPAVFEAYQALIPGAFKADLFRYCVLLIAGGIYADVDIHLESTLDLSIPPNVGFMVPIDEVRGFRIT